MGYWLPSLPKGSPAAIPETYDCEVKLFGMMKSIYIPIAWGGRWNAASVYIAQVPTAENMGQQVDAGKMSFLLAGSRYPYGEKDCMDADDFAATA